MAPWSLDNAPEQHGRVAIVTGANAGIGFETAMGLARKRAKVILACRNGGKAEAALQRVRAEMPEADVHVRPLDLADLKSVETFADGFVKEFSTLDLLINNAGVMVPLPGRTKQGFELQFGTNHLGHFALVGMLLPRLLRGRQARVVTLSSGMHHMGTLDLDDPNGERKPKNNWMAYAQSKLANLMFALELDRRMQKTRVSTQSVAAHPGITATELQQTSKLAYLSTRVMAMKPAEGALPTLRAALDPDVKGGSYWGPKGMFELMGPPAPSKISARARDEKAAADLWTLSERMTGVTYPWPA